MPALTTVPITPLRPERFADLLPDGPYRRFAEAADQARRLLDGRVVWSVNSTARGGGVAEMLSSLLAYICGAGIDARWVVIAGDPAFFAVTKRIHNHLHGEPGDGGALGEAERTVYERALEGNAEELARSVGSGDVVVLHDPQTAGLVPAIKATGARVVWRCHVGLDHPNDVSREAWHFLTGYVRQADACIFSREAFTWEGLEGTRIAVIPPSIDAFSPKNQELDAPTVAAILGAAGLGDPAGGDPVFERLDGTQGRVTRQARMYEAATLPASARAVVQVSRWDRLKDPMGVLVGFAEHVLPRHDAHLVLAGPDVEAVTDDPEGAEVLHEVAGRWESLPDDARRRVHLACLPMEDGDENAAMVNALQRRADIAVQKSLAEGFGLTVAEAMWKGRAVVASRIGGIQDQIEDGVTGVLLDPPADLAAFGAAVADLLDDAERRRRIGAEAQRRVRDTFLGPRHLVQWVELLTGMGD